MSVILDYRPRLRYKHITYLCSSGLGSSFFFALTEEKPLQKVFIPCFQSDVEISTESDASLALEVSNALTQSLLNYRLKTVTTGPKSVSWWCY